METKLSHKQHLDYIRKLSQVERSLLSSMQSLIDFQKKHTVNVSVTNPQESVKTPDIDKIIRALSIVNKNIEGSKVDISPLLKEVKSLDDTLKKLPKQMPTFEQKEAVEVSNLDTLSKKFESIEKAIKALKLKSPDVTVQAPDVKVEKIDILPLKSEISNVVDSIKNIVIPEVELTNVEDKLDTSNKQLEEANKKLQKIIEKPVGGGGGGGNGTPYQFDGRASYVDLESDKSIPVTVKNSTSSTVYSKPTDEYDLVQDDDTSSPSYEYYGYMKSGGGWYIKRITLSTTLREYVKGTSGYTTAWTNRASQTFNSYGAVF